ncbi:MAG: tripartite tricarboxylate transporter TctB family protein [Oscillospiraceae bacterium]|nr:tripartite tricarboxylate transporter TctB family protein [Oscillospiraceae bacterium]
MEIKKVQTKAFSNLVAALVLIAFEIWAWVQSGNIKSAKNAAVQPNSFPRIMIIGMAVFSVILLIQSIVKLAGLKPADPLAEKAESLNPVKDRGVLAALFVILLCVGFVACFKSLGYVVVSFLLSGIIMWLIGLRKPLPLILISLLVPLGMWLVFYKFLKVSIPMGVLQFLRDFVDTI